MSDFVSELASLLNRHSKENGSGTPDFILAEYLFGCLTHFNAAVNRRESWYGREQDQIFGTPVRDDRQPGIGLQEQWRIDIGYGGHEFASTRAEADERVAEIVEDWDARRHAARLFSAATSPTGEDEK